MDGDGARAERLSTVLWVMAVAFGVAGAVLTLVVWRSLDPRDGFPNLFSGLSGILYATLGAVIVRRARNPIGWILQGIALGLALLSFAAAYSVAGLVWRPGSFPGAVAAAGFADWVFGPTLTALGFLLFLFPTGRLPSPRWRPVLVVGLIAAGITTIGVIVNPVTYGVPAPGGVSSRIANPGGIEALGDAVVCRARGVDTHGDRGGGSGVRVADRSLPIRRPRRASADQVARVRGCAGARLAGGCVRLADRVWVRQLAGGQRRVHRDRGRRVHRHTGRDHDRDPAVPALRHRS